MQERYTTTRPGTIPRSVSTESLRRSFRGNKISDTGNKRSSSLSPMPKIGFTRDYVSSLKEDDDMLQDLDNLLRNRLSIASKAHSGTDKLRGSLDREKTHRLSLSSRGQSITNHFHKNDISHSRTGEDPGQIMVSLDTCTNSISEEGDHEEEYDFLENAEEAEEEAEEEDFANVDELDGPISSSSSRLPSLNIKFKNKAQRFSENEGYMDFKQSDLDEIDYNMPVGKELQRRLDKCAARIDSSSSYRSISQEKLDWNLKLFYGLRHEIDKWFALVDYAHLSKLQHQFHCVVHDCDMFLVDTELAKHKVNDLMMNLPNNLMSLTYISLGNCGDVNNISQHMELIKRNCLLIGSKFDTIISYFKDIASSCRDDKADLNKKSSLLFYASTIIYVTTCVCLEYRENEVEFEYVSDIIESIDKSDLLLFLTQYIESWRWSSRLSMRIRNVIDIFFKLLILQFGDESLYHEFKIKLYRFHGLKPPAGNSKILKISPIHYQAFQEDISSRYPSFKLPDAGLPKEIDKSSSLSQFLEIPRPKAKNPMNLNLSEPNQHLATPAPTPPDSPTLLSGHPGIKSRTSLQTNMAYPNLYPSDDEDDHDALDKISPHNTSNDRKGVSVPHSITEASKILSHNVDISLSVKQIWNERDRFMAIERGWSGDPQVPEDKYDYLALDTNTLDDEFKDCILTMKRIEKYYSCSLPYFSSLVFALSRIIESNMSNPIQPIDEFEGKNKIVDHVSSFEIVRAKETSLGSSCGIIYLLLKWFKLNHILKSENFAVLAYDSKIMNIAIDLLYKYSEQYVNIVTNKIIRARHSFWEECMKLNDNYFINDTKGNNTIDLGTPEYNINMLTSFTLLWKIIRKVTGSKTQRLKDLPLSIGTLFKKYYVILNMDIYHPILKITKELTPFKNKRWKSEHMELISGVYLYEKLELTDCWVTGKDISGELSDSYGQEIALRALVQCYNFQRYKDSMERLGYHTKENISSHDLLNKDTEDLQM